MNSRPGILCFGSVYWDDPFITPQQISLRLARRFDVLYVEPSPSFIYMRDAARNRRWLRAGTRPRRIAEGLYLYSPPPMLPFKGRSSIANSVSQRWIKRFVAHAMASVGMRDPVLFTYLPHTHSLVGCFKERLVCYYCIDDMGALVRVSPAVIHEYERSLLARAHLVFTTSRALKERFDKTHDAVHLVPNGSDPELYAQALSPETAVAPELAGLPRPILGFTGLTDFRVDQRLIAEAARRRPQWSFVFVGPVRTSVTALTALPNVHFVPSQPVTALPSFLKGFSVALIPYAPGPMVNAIYPTKLNDYLGAGLPVITTRLPELAGMPSDIVCQVETEDALVAAAERLVHQRGSKEVERRVAFARENSWDKRASLIGECIEARLRGGTRCEC